MRIAIIDLGTNSIRFDVHSVRANRRATLLYREKLMVRLGENVFLTGKLDPKAVRRTTQAFEHFHQVCQELKTHRISAFATSAMREAADGAELVKKVRQKTGISIHVISGEQEARLIAQGILKNEKAARGSFALMDIGGGSTEVSLCKSGRIVQCESYPLGVARLQQVFLHANPPTEGMRRLRNLRQHIRDQLENALSARKQVRPEKLIGSSGTMRTLLRMARKQTGGKYIKRQWLKQLVDKIYDMDAEQISRLDGMEPKRADLILAGILVLDETMRALGIERATATDYSLRDGILDQELSWLTRARSDGGEFAEFLDKAEKFGLDRNHLRWLLELAEQVFDKFRKVHKLENEWRKYLALAVIFRDTGRSISPIEHEKHSAYIVHEADLPFAEKWETDFVAELCLNHEKSKGADIQTHSKLLPAKARVAFKKLLALLQIIDALDSAYPRRVAPQRVRLSKHGVHVTLSKSPATELVCLKLQRKKSLFEETFRKSLFAQ